MTARKEHREWWAVYQWQESRYCEPWIGLDGTPCDTWDEAVEEARGAGYALVEVHHRYVGADGQTKVNVISAYEMENEIETIDRDRRAEERYPGHWSHGQQAGRS